MSEELETIECYKGPARIINVGTDEIPEKLAASLPPSDRGKALYLVYDVETAGGGEPRRYDVKVECSHRALKGNMLTWYRREDGRAPTQMDVAMKELERQGLVEKGAGPEALPLAIDDAVVGRQVFIRVTEDPRRDGSGHYPPRARFVSSSGVLRGSAAKSRLSALIGDKKAAGPAQGALSAPDEVTPF